MRGRLYTSDRLHQSIFYQYIYIVTRVTLSLFS